MSRVTVERSTSREKTAASRGGWRHTLGKTVASIGLRPMHVTVLSLIVTVAGAVMIGTGRPITGALVAAVGVSLDFVDGAVARATDRVTLVGGYVDSLFDRYADFALLFAVGLWLDDLLVWPFVAVAMFGTLVTSGAKWRAREGIAVAWPVRRALFVERPGRLTILLVAIFADGMLLSIGRTGPPVVEAGVLAVAILGNLAIVERMTVAVKMLSELDEER